MYAVLFDIDGTLLQTRRAGSITFAQTFADIFQISDIPDDVAYAGRSDRAIAGEIMKRCGIEDSTENWQQFKAGYCSRLERVLQDTMGEVLPGVVDLLDRLALDNHVAVGLLTGNMEFGAQAKTAAYGLADRFAFGGYGDQQRDRDHIAAEALNAAHRWIAAAYQDAPLCGTMVIGDTPADVQCGRAIDAFVVAVATGGSSAAELAKSDPNLLLEDLTEVGSLLAEISHAEKRCLELTG